MLRIQRRTQVSHCSILSKIRIPLQLLDSPISRSAVTGYGLEVQDSISDRGRDFPVLYRVHTASDTHWETYLAGTKDPFTAVKRPGLEANHSPCTSTLHTSSWRMA
jgi:hypothetical protein